MKKQETVTQNQKKNKTTVTNKYDRDNGIHRKGL